MGLQQQRAVAAAAEGAVDQRAAASRPLRQQTSQGRQAGQHGLGQHGHVLKNGCSGWRRSHPAILNREAKVE
jgi:hypothetical protein